MNSGTVSTVSGAVQIIVKDTIDLSGNRAIDDLPDYINGIAKDIHKKTSLAVTVLTGGPIPREKGKINTSRCVNPFKYASAY